MSKLVFHFSAPFRSIINCNTPLLLSETSNQLTLFKNIFSCLKDHNLVRNITSSAEEKNSELRYRTLSDDNIPLSSLPLFSIYLQIDNILKGEIPPFPTKIKYSIVNADVHYYDNSIGILATSIVIDDSDSINMNELFSNIDTWSVEFSQTIISCLRDIEDKAIHFSSISRLRKSRNALIHPDDMLIFDDVPSINHANNLLWVSRLACFSEPSKLMSNLSILSNWTENQSARKLLISEAELSIHIGNSYLKNSLNDEDLECLLSSLNICNYWYAFFDVINANLYKKYAMLLGEKKVQHATQVKVERVYEHVLFMMNELSNFSSNIQGRRKHIVEEFFNCWEINNLLDRASSCINLLEKKITQVNQKKNERFNRIFEAILTAIGGIALLDFTLNLVSFSHNKEKPVDATTGLSDWVLLAPHDGIINILLIIIVILMIVAYRK